MNCNILAITGPKVRGVFSTCIFSPSPPITNITIDIHASRPHPGQQVVAARLRALLDSSVHPSEIRGMCVNQECIKTGG